MKELNKSTTGNIVLEKSLEFAIRIIKLSSYLREERREFTLSKQLIRSGTSVGANLTEAQFAISEKEFLSKAYIAFKECAETKYWLTLLHKTNYLSDIEYDSINQDCVELMKLLSSITLTIKNKIRND